MSILFVQIEGIFFNFMDSDGNQPLTFQGGCVTLAPIPEEKAMKRKVRSAARQRELRLVGRSASGMAEDGLGAAHRLP